MQSTYIPRAQLPLSLQHIPKPPMGLYVQGDSALLSHVCISIVGSRKMTDYGKQVLQIILPELVEAGLTIVSGLAYGIDAEAHRVMLRCGGKGIAVLGTPLSVMYPSSHTALRQALLAQGSLVVSEYPEETVTHKYHFWERNRIIAALSKVTLIVEAAEKSGTLSTAQAALDANQTVCVVPADITRVGSRGVYRLMQQGAYPVTSAQDILQHYRSEQVCIV